MKNLKQKALTGVAMLSALAINTSQTLAQGLSIDPSIAPTGVKSTDFKTAVLDVLNYFLAFLGLLALIFIIYAGVKMVISQGEEDDFKTGKDIIIYAIIGIVVIVLSWSIVNFALGTSA